MTLFDVLWSIQLVDASVSINLQDFWVNLFHQTSETYFPLFVGKSSTSTLFSLKTEYYSPVVSILDNFYITFLVTIITNNKSFIITIIKTWIVITKISRITTKIIPSCLIWLLPRLLNWPLSRLLNCPLLLYSVSSSRAKFRYFPYITKFQ